MGIESEIFMSRNLKEIIIIKFKWVYTLINFIIFFSVFSIKYNALTVPSRTLAMSLSTYVISYALFTRIYGSFRIGKQKSKQIIANSTLTLFFTSVTTYIIILVMSTNPNNVHASHRFKIENLEYLLIALLFQLVITIMAAYLGNHIYFRLFRPENTLILYDPKYSGKEEMEHYLLQHRKEYKLISLIEIKDFNLDTDLLYTDLVVFSDMKSEFRNAVINECYARGVNFSYVPTINDVISMSGSHVVYGDKPVVQVDLCALNIFERFQKRAIDLIFAALILVFTLPVSLIIAMSIKLDDQGPIFFRQERKTIGGKIFQVYKFRSMKLDSGNYSVTSEDDRITRVGKVIRKLRVDELPQMLNILKGDMSVVGPRPEMIENVEMYEKEMPEFAYRLKVKAGLTGLAQIEGKYNTSPKDKLILDLIYIENYSIWFDMKLIFRTAIVFFKSDSTEGF